MDNVERQRRQYLGFIEAKQDNLSHFFESVSTFDLEKIGLPEEGYLFIPEKHAKVVLGKRAELYFQDYIARSHRYQLLAMGTQVVQDNVTLGELDFIVLDKIQNHYLHIELACKFYLHIDGINLDRTDQWIGPNKKDSLANKIAKLKNKQFPLLQKPEAHRALQSHGLFIDKPIYQKLCFKSWRFLPFSALGALKSNNDIAGAWVHFNDFKSTFGDIFTYHIPDKQDWMVNPKSNITWKPFAMISAELQTHLLAKRSPLVWVKDDIGNHHSIFVVWW